MTRYCKNCEKSLFVLSILGIKEEDGICHDCLVPTVDAKLMSYTVEDNGIEVEVDLSGYGGMVDAPDSKPGVEKRESSNLSTRTKSIQKEILEYVYS